MLKSGTIIAGASRTNLVRIRGEDMARRDEIEEPFGERRDQMTERGRVPNGGTGRAPRTINTDL